MEINEFISEIIYYFKYFKMIEIDNKKDKILIATEIADRLENMVFLENLVALFQLGIRKKSMNEQNQKRLDVLLVELKNRKTMLES